MNNGEPAEGGDGGGETGGEELVTLLVTPMREGRELNPAVRKLSAKYLSEQRPAESGHRAGRGRRQPKMQRVRRTRPFSLSWCRVRSDFVVAACGTGSGQRTAPDQLEEPLSPPG